jgi:hypothetical protein
VGTIRQWSAPASWETVCRRASARRQLNAVKTFLATERRRQVLELLIAFGGLRRGVQTKIAKLLKVHPSVISKDINHHLLPLARPCETCGTLRPRAWWVED